MYRQWTLLLGLMALYCGLIACGDGFSEESVPEGKTFTLQYNPNLGDSFQYVIKFDMSMDMDGSGPQSESKSLDAEGELELVLYAKKPSKEGGITLAGKFDRVAFSGEMDDKEMSLELSGGSVEMTKDGDPVTGPDKQQLETIWRMMSQNAITVTLDKHGKVLSLDLPGLEGLSADAMPGGGAKDMIQAAGIPTFPDKALKIGDSWDSGELGNVSGMNMGNMSLKNTLVAYGKYKDEESLKVVSEANMANVESKEMPFNVNGSIAGTSYVSPTSGMIQGGKLKAEFSMSGSMGDSKVDMKITLNASIEKK